MDRILIKNVGPIRECEFEVKPINIFIGPQATGKSTIAKLVYFFRSVYGLLISSTTEALMEQKDFKVTFNALLKRKFPVPTIHLEEKTEVKFYFSKKLWIKSKNCFKVDFYLI